MGTITMTGYNNIDWNAVLTAVMSQESQPLTLLANKRTSLSSQSSAYGVLAGYVGSLESAAADLATESSVAGRSASSSDASVVSASASSSALVGAYDVVVNKLARAQVTATTAASAVASTDTVVANGGSLTINGKTVSLSGDTTLAGLSAAINETADIGVRSTIISADGKYQLVLTGTEAGASNAFTVQNDLTGSTLAFSATNAVNASDADFTVNNVRVTSSTNTVTGAIPGVTLTLSKESTTPTVVSVAQDTTRGKDKLKAFVSAYNTLVSYIDSQNKTAANGDTGSIGRDSLLRSLRRQLNSTLLAQPGVSGSLAHLSELGVAFERNGTITFDESTFDSAAETNFADIEKLLAGDGTSGGVFDAVQTTIKQYTSAGGLLSGTRTRLTEQISTLDDRIADMEERLALRKLALQKEYAAADSAIATLNSQANSLSGLV